MKQPTVFFEMSSVAVALLVAMLIAMWAGRPDASCTRASDPPRQLVLSRETDREHLAADLSSADRTARRYMRSAVDENGQRSRFSECVSTLVQQIATTHGLPLDVVRARPPDSH
jgi:hypothetical protein